MKKITHEIFGVGATLFILMPPMNVIGYVIFFSIIGSIFPDIDFKFKHRIFFHNIFSLMFTSMILYCVLSNFLHLGKYAILFVISFAIGYFSHILLDMLTKAGVAIVWPLSSIRLSFLEERYDNPYLNIFVSLIGIMLMVAYTYLAVTGGAI